MRGSDGKVAYERSRGKQPTVLGVEFGEKVLYKLKKGNKMEKLNARWDYGIFVGIRRRSNEVMVSTKEGIVMARSIKRIPVESRWGNDCLEWVKWAPWNRYKDAEDADGEVPEGVPAEELRASESGDSVRREVVFVNTRERTPKDFFLFRIRI